MSKKERTPLWKRFRKENLSGGDMALFLCSFTAIFGILCNKPGGSIYYLVMFGLYALIWIVLSFGGGRRLVKGMWITGSVLWGMTLLYCVLNWVVVVPMGNPETIGTFLAVIIAILSFPATAMLNPVFPLLYRLGYVASKVPEENAEFAVVLCLCCIAIVALAFFMGWIYERNSMKKRSVSNKALKMEIPDELKF